MLLVCLAQDTAGNYRDSGLSGSGYGSKLRDFVFAWLRISVILVCMAKGTISNYSDSGWPDSGYDNELK